MRVLRYLVVWVVAAVACLVGLVPTATFVLVVPGVIIFPLATGLGALFAAIAANMMGNFLAPDRTRGRLLPIVGVTQVAAAVVAVGFLALLYYQGAITGFMSPLLNPLLVSTGLISLSATAATGYLRTAEDTLERDIWISVGLVVLGLLVVFVVVPSIYGVLCRTVVSCPPY